MALSNELEELLSGYLDNQLNAEELRKVRIALQNPVVQARYDDLCQMRNDLKALAAVPVRSLPSDFAQRVLSAAIAQFPTKSSPVLLPNPGSLYLDSNPGQRSRSKWVAACVSIAAAIALAIWIPSIVARRTAQPNDMAGLNSSNTQSSPIEEVTSQSDSMESVPNTKLVGRNDLLIRYILTVDLEMSENSSIAETLIPLMQKHGIAPIKGAKVEGEVKVALDKARVTVPPAEAPLPSEVYLIRGHIQSLDTILQTIREDGDKFPVVRFGMAVELPSDPLLDKFSANSNGPIVLGQSMANAVSSYVNEDDSFAVPLVGDQDNFRASPFESIPYQGKLVGSANRKSKPTLSQFETDSDDGQYGFLLMFVRQRD